MGKEKGGQKQKKDKIKRLGGISDGRQSMNGE